MPFKVTQYVAAHHDIVDPELEERFPEVIFCKVGTVAELADAMLTTSVLITSSTLYTPEVGRTVVISGRQLKWIQFTTVGIEGVLTNGVPDGVILTNARGARTKVVAGHAMALMLGVMRGFRSFEPYRARRSWAREEVGSGVVTTEGRTMVIVGVGDIGRDIARKAKAFDMKVIGVSRAAEPGGPIDEVVPRSKLRDVLPLADVLMLSGWLDDATHHIIGAAEIAALMSSAVIVNIARGPLIDEQALVEALRKNRIAGAAMDVTEIEPLAGDSALWDLDNVLLSPHVAGQGAHSQKPIMRELFTDNLNRLQKGEPLRNVLK